MRLTEQQWTAMENLLPESGRTGRPGRPAADNRSCVEGILWVLRSGARWRDLPPQYPSPVTCWPRRITQEHRLVYRVSDARIDFLQARYHY